MSRPGAMVDGKLNQEGLLKMIELVTDGRQNKKELLVMSHVYFANLRQIIKEKTPLKGGADRG